MNAETMSPSNSPLQAIQGAYEHALTALNDPAKRLDAVVWLSAHLSAIEHVVCPVLAKKFGASAPPVVALRRKGIEMEQALRTLERTLSGDASVMHLVDCADFSRRLTELVSERAADELVLLERLSDQLSAADQRRLAELYHHTLETAPTRPHPHSPHSGVLGSVAYHVNARRDHVMDVFDARGVPTPHRAPTPLKSGRWGDYLLGHGTKPETELDELGPAVPDAI
jgi:hypothetical protein